MPKNKTLDLHVHSSFSDGSLPPEDLASRAVKNNVTTLAITDHDTMAGAAEKAAACKRYGIECVFGVEISCALGEREVHMLALFADPDSPHAKKMQGMSDFRKTRMIAMLEKLEEIGLKITLEELPVGEDGVYGRPHLARAMVEKGFVKNVSEAFGRYLYDGGPIQIPKHRMTADQGIALARQMGGVAVLAHPGVSNLLDDLDTLVEMGLDGIEAYHPKHGGETIARILRYCNERKLLVSGGSDFHSPGDGADIGGAHVPLDLLEPLRATAMGRRKGE